MFSLLAISAMFLLVIWLGLGIILMIWLLRSPRVATRMVVFFGDPQPIEEVFTIGRVWFAIKGVDSSGNVGLISNFWDTTFVDGTLPEKIIDLH